MERSESGFTLIELLVVLVIMPLIIGAIAAVVVTGLLNQQSVSSRMTDSTSAELASAYFVRDVQSANFVTTDTDLAGNPNNAPPCGYNPTSEEYYVPPLQATPDDPTPPPPGWLPARYDKSLSPPAWVSPSSGIPIPPPTPTFVLGLSWSASGPDTASSTAVSYSTWSNGDLVRLSCDAAAADSPRAVTVATGLVHPTTPCSKAMLQSDPLSCLGTTATIAPAAAAAAAQSGWQATAGAPGISAVTLSGLTAATNYSFNLVGVPRIASPQNQGIEAGTPTSPALLLMGSTPPPPPPPSLTCSAGAINVNGDASISGAASLTSGAELNVTGRLDTTASPASDPFSDLTPPSDPSPGSASGSAPTISYSPGTYSNLVVPNNTQAVLNSGVYIVNGDLTLSGDSTLTSADGGVPDLRCRPWRYNLGGGDCGADAVGVDLGAIP